MADSGNQSISSTPLAQSAIVPVLLSILLYLIDIVMGFGGLHIGYIRNNLLTFWQTSGLAIVSITAGVLSHYLLMRHGNFDKREAILFGIFTALFLFILFIGGRFLIIHLALVAVIVYLLKSPNMDTKAKLSFIITFYIIDFFLVGILNSYLKRPNPDLYFVIPFFQIFVLTKALEYESNKFFRTLYQLSIATVVIAATFQGIYDVNIYNAAVKESPEYIKQNIVEFYTTGFKNFGNFVAEITFGVTTLFNVSQYTYTGQQEQTQNPQGIFIEPLEPGHIFTEGMPVYAWALLEARTLDDPITALISCKTERKTQYGDQEIMGIADPDQLLVIKGAERSISCEFPPLPEDSYNIIFNAQFNFSADARKKIYLMDRDRMLDDLRLLRQKGIEPARDTLLRELYDITDTDPELIYTSGPIAIGMKTDNVPWDVGRASQSPLKPLFGVTITNYWPKGGRIKRINNLYFKIPDEMNLLTELCDPNTPMDETSEESEPGYKVYKLNTEELIATRGEEILIDIDEFRTFNCRIEVDENSLDNIPVTTRFLKVHVDYDYVLEEELDIDVERLELGEDAQDILNRNQFCCQRRSRNVATGEESVIAYELTDTLEECYIRDSFVYGIDVDMKYCEQLCCEIMLPGDTEHRWVEDTEECTSLNIDEDEQYNRIVDKSNCEIE